MKVREGITEAVFFKDHLQRLPLEKDLVYTYPETSKELVILVPVFSFGENRPEDLLDYIVPSLIYQKRSFQLNTDIVAKGVAIKPYIPEDVYPIIKGMLYEAGYTDDDVFLYDDTNTARKEAEGYTKPFGARFLFLNDERFDDYEYVFTADSDLQFAKSTLLPEDEIFPFVDFCCSLPKDNWYVAHTDFMWNLEADGPRGNWRRRVDYNDDVWYAKAAEYTGYDVRHIKMMLSSDQSSVLYPKAYLDAGFREELARGIEILQDDEAFTALWTLNNPFPGSLRAEGLDTWNGVPHTRRLNDEKKFYIAHVRTDWEFLWREQIGAV